MRNLKGQKAITLIALVITIIVLLILAGISISMLSGENSILSRAGQARDRTEESQIKEEVSLAWNGVQTDGYINGWDLNKKAIELQIELRKKDSTATVTVDGKKLNVAYKGYDIVIDTESGKLDVSTSNISVTLTLSDTPSVPTVDGTKVKTLTPDNVPIPGGFYYVGGTKSTGVVISDSSSDEGKGADADLVGNQFVWVPVAKNQVLTLDVKSEKDITGIKLTMPDGTQSNISASGKTYNAPITMTKNGVYTVEVTTGADSRTAQKRITSLYAQDIEMCVMVALAPKLKNPDYTTIEALITDKVGEGKTVEDLLQSTGDTTLGKYFFNQYIYVVGYEEELKAELRSMFAEYVDNNQNTTSVNTYGGFYIARYEAGDGTTESARTSSSSDTNTLVSKKGAFVYNNIACEDSSQAGDAKRLANGMYSTSTSVTSQLITGAGWDRTLNWIIETDNNLGENEVILDSRSWGNYSNSTGNALENSGSSKMNYTTGRSEYWKANNIYDLAGNTWEWTQEKQGTGSVARGGVFSYSGDNYPASYRTYLNATHQGDSYSFRTQLYIKQ